MKIIRTSTHRFPDWLSWHGNRWKRRVEARGASRGIRGERPSHLEASSTPRRCHVTSRHVTRVNSCQRHTRPAHRLLFTALVVFCSLVVNGTREPRARHSRKHFPLDSNSHLRTCSSRTPPSFAHGVFSSSNLRTQPSTH